MEQSEPPAKRHTKVNRSSAIAAAIATGVAGLLLGTLTGAGAHSASSNTAATTSITATAVPSRPVLPTSPAAPVGSTLTLSGGDEKLAVTVVRIEDPAIPARALEGADQGTRFVAVLIHLTNKAATFYGDDPGNDGTLYDSVGRPYRQQFATVTLGQPFIGDLDLKPGESATGVILFEAPKDRQPAEFQFTLLAGQTGRWQLG